MPPVLALRSAPSAGAAAEEKAASGADCVKDSEDAAPAPGGKAHRTDGVEQLEASDLLTPLQPLAEEASDLLTPLQPLAEEAD